MQEREEKKYEARIRRMINGTKKHASTVPEIVHKLWAKGKKARREMAKILIQCGGDKDPYQPCMVSQVEACVL